MDETFLDYRRDYILTHPILLFREVGLRIRWAWQRVFRGWDDRAVWSIDSYLADQIIATVYRLKTIKHGIPMSMFENDDFEENGYDIKPGHEKVADERWDKILDKIIAGFGCYKKLEDLSWVDTDETAILRKVYEEGFDILREHFSSLWD
jgi:hypothetical protein